MMAQISNLYNFQVINKTSKGFEIELKLISPNGEIQVIGELQEIQPRGISKGACLIKIPRENLEGKKTSIIVEVWSEGKVLDEIEMKLELKLTNFMGNNHLNSLI